MKMFLLCSVPHKHKKPMTRKVLKTFSRSGSTPCGLKTDGTLHQTWWSEEMSFTLQRGRGRENKSSICHRVYFIFISDFQHLKIFNFQQNIECCPKCILSLPPHRSHSLYSWVEQVKKWNFTVLETYFKYFNKGETSHLLFLANHHMYNIYSQR